MIRSRFIGCGSYLPKKTVTNDDLSRFVDTTDDWVVGRTGIRERHIAADDETTADLAEKAARDALAAAKLTPDDLDLIVLATSTPDNTFPATATRVQARLGMTRGLAFDVQAVCAGFICALSVADSFIKAGQVRTAMIIGAETYSRILDWSDRATCVLFGDGAGAAILRAEEGAGTSEDRGVLSVKMHSDGRHYDALYVDGGVSSTQTAGHLRMNGREVFRHAVGNLASVAEEAIAAAGITADQVDWLIPHQANKRIMEATAKKLDLSMDKVVVTVDRHANTSSASIPLALCDASADGRVKPGQILVIEDIGGGFVWGGAVVRW